MVDGGLDVVTPLEFLFGGEIFPPYQTGRNGAYVDRAGQVHSLFIHPDFHVAAVDVAAEHRLGGGNAGGLGFRGNLDRVHGRRLFHKEVDLQLGFGAALGGGGVDPEPGR